MRWVKWAVAIFASLVVAAVAVTFFQVYRDREIRALAHAGANLGMQVAGRLLGAAPGQGRWPEDGAKYLPGGVKSLPAQVESIQVVQEGLVRVTFRSR